MWFELDYRLNVWICLCLFFFFLRYKNWSVQVLAVSLVDFGCGLRNTSFYFGSINVTDRSLAFLSFLPQLCDAKQNFPSRVFPEHRYIRQYCSNKPQVHINVLTRHHLYSSRYRKKIKIKNARGKKNLRSKKHEIRTWRGFLWFVHIALLKITHYKINVLLVLDYYKALTGTDRNLWFALIFF